MDQFLSTFVNKVDSKGRVSVPAEWRSVLASRSAVIGGSPTLILGPSSRTGCLEGGGENYLSDLEKRINSLDAFDEAREFLIDAVIPSLSRLPIDGDGRIIIANVQGFSDQAGLAAPGNAVFVGRLNNFQIWHPDRWTAHMAEARAKAKGFFARSGSSK